MKMKKTTFTLEGIINSKNSFYLLLILISLFFQSCAGEILGSSDVNEQFLKGPSYPRPSHSDAAYSANFGFLFSLSLLNGLGKYHDKGAGTFRR